MVFMDGVEEPDTGKFESSEWDIVQKEARKNFVYYPCCDEPYPDLTYNITISGAEGIKVAVLLLPITFFVSVFWRNFVLVGSAIS